MESVFRFSDYKAFLQLRAEAAWGEISKLAEAAGCQRSYLSRVIRGPVHLLPDHAYGLCEYWRLSAEETEYFLAMLDHARSGSPQYRKHLERKLSRMKREHENLANRVSRPRLETSEKENAYYASWLGSAIHILTSIPRYQTPKAISEKLGVPLANVSGTLDQLEGFGLIRARAGRYEFASGEVHIPKDSPLVSLHHGNWRQRAVLDSQAPHSDSVHYTNVQSMSPEAYESIRGRVIRLVEESAKIAGPSASEEFVCMTIDFFRP